MIALTHYFIRTAIADGVGHVELHRPERLNALSKEMLLEIGEAMDAFEREDAVRVIVLSGAGRGFSSGFDPGVTRVVVLRVSAPPRFVTRRGSVSSKGVGRVGPRDTPRWDQRCQHGDGHHDRECADENHRVGGTHLVQP